MVTVMNESTFGLWICCGRCGHGQTVTPSNFSLPVTMTTKYLVYGIICFVLSLIAIGTNMVFLLAIKRNRSLQSGPTKLLTMLAIADLLQGCITFPLYSIYLLKAYHLELNCLLNDVMVTINQQ